MIITEVNKTRIPGLLRIALEQIGSIDSVNLNVNSDFNLEPFIPCMLNDKWPHAVDPLLIADPNSEDDKISRAHGILMLVVTEPITGKFLDFGCGEGHVVAEVVKKNNLSVGYDIVDQNWTRFPSKNNMIMTTDWQKVVDNGPYSHVLIYDVLDHLKDEEEVVESLKKVKTVLAPEAKLFVRCHPFCSRHGTHLYNSVNRAYLHLCLDEETLNKLGYTGYLHTIKVIHPLQTYKEWFTRGGFNVVSSNITPESVEPFFQQPGIAELIKKNWKKSHESGLASGKVFPEWQLRQQFIDYVLNVV